jgi:two-component system, cell cycle response regulator
MRQEMAELPLILVADDDEDIRFLVRVVLERGGYRVIAAPDGESALRLVEEQAPDLVLLDVSMPVMGGHELCQAITAGSSSPPPVIFLSAHATPEDRVRGLEVGAIDYIVKPFDRGELLARVSSAMRTRTRMTELAQNAAVDHLTGAMNRSQLDTQLAAAVARALRSRGDLGLVLVDIDHFKSINDRFGHSTGDSVLRVVAVRLMSVIRAGDALFRFGGDEFCFLLEGTDDRGGSALAHRAVDAIASEQIMDIAVTASAGAATWSPLLARPLDLLNAADAALYEAKHSGRAQARAWSDLTPSFDQLTNALPS